MKASKTPLAIKTKGVKLSSGSKKSNVHLPGVLRDAAAKSAGKGTVSIVGFGSFNLAKKADRRFAVGVPASTDTKLSHEALAQIAAAFRPA
jgi:nucleoid DNA-binding protein